MQTLQQAFRFRSWSNTRIFDAVNKLGKDPVSTVAIEFISQQLNHLIIVEDLFRARLLGEDAPHSATNSTEVPTFDLLKLRLIRSGEWYIDFVLGLDDAALERSYQFEFTDGLAGQMTTHEILFHIIQHGAYHRGSIARSLDLAGVDHPADSFTIFLHQTQPQRRVSP